MMLALLVKQSKTTASRNGAFHHRLYASGASRPACRFKRSLAARLGIPTDGAPIYLRRPHARSLIIRAIEMLKDLAKEDKFAAVQLSLLDHVTCEQRLPHVQPKIISQDPYIALYPSLFSTTECKYLAMVAAPWLKKAQVTMDGGMQFQGMRDADSSAISHLTEDLVIQRINRCIVLRPAPRPVGESRSTSSVTTRASNIERTTTAAARERARPAS